MRNRGVVVAVIVACFSCFSTARYDRAHTQRVSAIQARYDAEIERERQRHAALVAELDRRRASVIPVGSDASHAPLNPVTERADIVECRRRCETSSPRPPGASRARTPAAAQCLATICQPAYADALIKTYFRADFARIHGQLGTSNSADLESLLAASHNQAVLAEIDQQSALLAQRHARARSRIEQLRQRDLAAAQQLRAQEIEAGRAERRARMRAAADAFAAEARGQPAIAPAASSRSTTHAADDHRPADCAPAAACPTPPAPPSTCEPDASETVGQAGPPSSRKHPEPSTPIGCLDDSDCPGGTSCDTAAGVCCATIVR